MPVNLENLSVGDVFSEESHYVFEGLNGTQYQFKHLESQNSITLDQKYVGELLTTADQFDSVQKVGKEDKLWTAKQIADAEKSGELAKGHETRVGDVRLAGIRTIWTSIHSAKVFTVNFNKQSSYLSAKALKEARDKQADEALKAITAAKKANNTAVLLAEITKIQNSPVLPEVKGAERTLVGYKVQFKSDTGMYKVIDAKEPVGQNERQVNINEINWLVVDGVKFEVE